MRKFAISDIHGHAATFKALLQKINFSKSDQLYLLGDYVDRGPDSKGVIDHIFELKEQGHQLYCLKGNHEATMVKAITEEETRQNWLYYGGQTTLESFGVSDIRQIPKRYWDFIDTLDIYLEVDDFILVHAGLNFEIPNPFEGLHSMLWIREWYDDINYDWLGERIIIHGHTPIPKDLIKLMVSIRSTRQAIDIDNGCFVNWKAGMGQLCALQLDTFELTFQKGIG